MVPLKEQRRGKRSLQGMMQKKFSPLFLILVLSVSLPIERSCGASALPDSLLPDSTYRSSILPDSLPPAPVPLSGERVCPVYIELHGYRGFGVKEFNSVDGFVLSYGATIGGRFSEWAPTLDAAVRYSTERSRGGWLLDFRKSFEHWGYFTAGITWSRVTDTYDTWRMGDLESSLASFVVKESLRHYYEREGVSFYVSTEAASHLTLRTSYTLEDHRSLRARDPWTIPGDSKEFRENPPIDAGRFSALTFQAAYDTRDNIRMPHEGWYHEAILEVARDELGGDFDFTRWFLHLRRYHTLAVGHSLNTRLALAGSRGTLLRQRLLTAGGIGTLRGYDDLIISGDHMVLANVEYRFPTGLEKIEPVLIVFNEVNGMLFFDVGKTWFAEKEDGEGILSDIGIGFSGTNFLSYFGLYIAWPLSGDAEGSRLSIKIQRDF
jgi:hypothetical protein